MAIRKKQEFLQPGGRYFLNGDKPDQAIFEDLFDSITFKKELSDRAKLSEAGLSKITTDDKVNNRDHTDQAGVSPSGFPTFMKPSQLPRIFTEDTEVTIELVDRQFGDPGYDDAPGIKDIKISIDPEFPAVVSNTNAITFSGDTLFNYLTGTVPCSLVISDAHLPADMVLTALLNEIVDRNNDTVAIIKALSDYTCTLNGTVNTLSTDLTNLTNQVNLITGNSTPEFYEFTALDLFPGVLLPADQDTDFLGNQYKCYLVKQNGIVQMHGKIVADDIAGQPLLRIPRSFIEPVALTNPNANDRKYTAIYGNVALVSLGVDMTNIHPWANPGIDDWGVLWGRGFIEASIWGAGARPPEQDANSNPGTPGYEKYTVDLNHISWNLNELPI